MLSEILPDGLLCRTPAAAEWDPGRIASAGLVSRSVAFNRDADRRGQWAMTVNERCRICFEFRKGDAHEVEIVDHHRV